MEVNAKQQHNYHLKRCKSQFVYAKTSNRVIKILQSCQVSRSPEDLLEHLPQPMSVSKKDVTFNELPTNEFSIWQLSFVILGLLHIHCPLESLDTFCNIYCLTLPVGMSMLSKIQHLTIGLRSVQSWSDGKRICNSEKINGHSTEELHWFNTSYNKTID